jgi:hypothetical protein
VPFRAKGLAAIHQIEQYDEGERNPYYHSQKDTVEHMNIDYWVEQIKATIAVTATLAGVIEK